MNFKPLICFIGMFTAFASTKVQNTPIIYDRFSTSKPEMFKAILKRPSDWNRDFWITERLDNLSFDGWEYNYKEYTAHAKNYPDNFYEVCDRQEPKQDHGLLHTRYVIMDNEGDIFIHSIRIADPSVTLYGLTLTSSKEDIKRSLLSKPSFRVRETLVDSNLKVCATYQDSITFFFFENAICIEMEVPTED